MPKIDKLLYQALIPPFLIALSVLTFVIFVREIGRLSELLITKNASPGVISLIAGVILPPILIFTLPLSFLIGLLIGLGGLSGENQIIALRACGVPITKLLRPVMTLALIVGILTGLMSIYILPQANDVLRSIKDKISLRQATSQIQPRVFNEEFPNLVFYLDDLSTDRQKLSRVFLTDNSDPKSIKTVIAKEGSWITDVGGSRLQLHLESGVIYEVDPENPNKDKVSLFAATDIPIVFTPTAAQGVEPASDLSRPKKPSEMSTLELWKETRPGNLSETRVELHRRLAIPFSVMAFALLGLPLGITTKKGGRTSGFVLSLALVLLFYVMFGNGLRLASVGKLSPWLGAWGANICLGLIGLVFLTMAERATRFNQAISTRSSYLKRVPFLSWKPPLPAASREGSPRIKKVFSTQANGIARFRFPKVLDLYISRGFLIYFLWSAIVCYFLFVVLTLFDLLDDIIRHHISAADVLSYFFFLTPHILMLVVPMAILLAILISFGILEKHSEVTALKAGGWSLYRISIPIFLMAAVLCVSLYFLQDYVLPYANIRQDSLRNVIKGRPAQTSMRPQRKWIIGESNRIFNYGYFDANQSVFVSLNVYEIDLHNLKLKKRIHADRASVEADGEWMLENGWIRDFQADNLGFRRIGRETLFLPEKTAYFQKEIFEPKESSKLTYLELKEYISYLKKSGYNATELQVELHKKLSFPISCVVMTLLGVPFSFSMGRKGAFFGIAVSITIAMSYWGVFGVFEQLGAYGFLIPILAAWAPNLIFSSAALILLFTIRT